MGPPPRPLLEVWAEMPAVRKRRGKRHALAAILALAGSAMRCGSRSSPALAAWGRHSGARLTRAWGFTRQPPCAATLHTVLRRVDREAWEGKRSAWAEGLRAGTPLQDVAAGMAIEGTTWRGSQQPGAPGAHLLSALAPRVGFTLAQQAVDDQTNETPVALDLLRHLGLEGRLVTMDALRTQRQSAPQIVDAGGDEVLGGTENQAPVWEDIAPVWARAPIAGEQRTAAATLALGPGRSAPRWLQTRNGLGGYSDWPGLAQVFQRERHVLRKKTGEVREERVAGGTSLPLERADATRLLALVRSHWHSENTSHGVREVTCDEERSQGWCGNLPQVMAALRHTVIGRMRRAGSTNIAAACRRFAAQPAFALALIGIALENCMALVKWMHA